MIIHASRDKVFENTDRYTDYITEKLYSALLAGAVPVYWYHAIPYHTIPSDTMHHTRIMIMSASCRHRIISPCYHSIINQNRLRIIVPLLISRGAPNIRDVLPGPKSAVIAADFDSPKAHHLPPWPFYHTHYTDLSPLYRLHHHSP